MLRRSSALLGLLICASASRAAAQEADRWLAPDKALHFSVSAVLGAGSYAGATLVLEAPWQRALLAGGITLSLGVGKELYDATGHGDPSLRDLAWDVIGCVVGVGLAYVIDLAFRSDGPEHSRSSLPTQPLMAAGWAPRPYFAAAGSGEAHRPYTELHLRSEF